MTSLVAPGSSVLRTRAASIARPYPELQGDIARVITALSELRRHHPHVRGISAPQIGVARRILVIDLGAGPFVMLDPEITWRSEESYETWDHCVSVSERPVRVRRHRAISVTFRDHEFRWRAGVRLASDVSALLQHEIDHLDGALLSDRAVEVQPEPSSPRLQELLTSGHVHHRLSLERIREAAACIDPVFLGSPQFVCEPLCARLRCRLTLKIETVNPIRSFKGRGADYFVSKASPWDANAAMVCASAGNFGQAMAYVCRRRGLHLHVFAARNANPLKLQRMREFGATLHLAGDDFQAAKEAARAWAEERGLRFVEDGREVHISEGAGSIAVELLARADALDTVIVPVGDGALLSGVARWIKAASPTTRVVGACARGARAMYDAWRATPPAGGGETSVSTIADGIAVRVPIAESVSDLRALADDILLVSEDSLLLAMRLLYDEAGLVTEPAGAAGIAAILEHMGSFEDERVATVLCGSNITREQMRTWGIA